MAKFECKMFGDCCRNLISQNGGEDLPENEALRVMVKPEERGLNISDWEYTRIRATADKLGLYVDIKPKYVLLSAEGDLIVVDWAMSHEDCPFLAKDNKCNIYSERPVACKAYPLFFEAGEGITPSNRLSINTNCRCLDAWKGHGASTAKGSALKEDFGEMYEQAISHDSYRMMISFIASELVEKGLIMPNDLTREKMWKKYYKSYYRFTEFLERHGYGKADEDPAIMMRKFQQMRELDSSPPTTPIH
jgi:Fe-S-cluster containining protein